VLARRDFFPTLGCFEISLPSGHMSEPTPTAAEQAAISSAALFFKRLMELIPDHVYFKDREGRFLAINRAQASFFRLKNPEEAVGKSDYDFFEESSARQKDADEREIVRTGVGFVAKEERSDALDAKRWVISTKLPLIGENGEIIGTFGISHDVTDRKNAQEALQAQHTLLRTLIEILPCRIFAKDSAGRLTITNQAYRRVLGVDSELEVAGRRRDEIIQDPSNLRVAKDDELVMTTGVAILNREDLSVMPTGGKRWSLLSKVPLRDGSGTIVGIVGMSADITSQKDAEARAVRAQKELETRTLQMESEIALAREMQTELMAASIQSVRDTLNYQAPFAPQIAFAYEPSAHLGGDFIHAVPLSSHEFGLLVCDVMGHGVKAALVTTFMRGLLAEVTARDVKPSHVLFALNDRLCSLLDRPAFPRFVTALYATIDISAGRLEVSNAGHPWPLILKNGRKAHPLSSEESCPALGLIPKAPYSSVELSLSKGDRLLLYTDGIQEEKNWAGDEFGKDRLGAFLEKSAKRTVPEAIHDLLCEVRAFSGAPSAGDDLCAVMAGF
jgi:sigma-B regulation protein RsbU (phosphoserine phosphatase)